MSESLSSLLTKEWLERFAYGRYLTKSDMSDLLVFCEHYCTITVIKRAICYNKFFHCFSPFYAQEQIGILLFRLQKMSDLLKKPKNEFPILQMT